MGAAQLLGELWCGLTGGHPLSEHIMTSLANAPSAGARRIARKHRTFCRRPCNVVLVCLFLMPPCDGSAMGADSSPTHSILRRAEPRGSLWAFGYGIPSKDEWAKVDYS